MNPKSSFFLFKFRKEHVSLRSPRTGEVTTDLTRKDKPLSPPLAGPSKVILETKYAFTLPLGIA